MTLVASIAAPCPRCHADLVVPWGGSRIELRPASGDVRVLPATSRRRVFARCPSCHAPLVARPWLQTIDVQEVSL